MSGPDNELLAFIMYKVMNERACLSIANVAVPKNQRRRGYGRIIVKWMINYAKKSLKHLVNFLALSSLPNTIKFYKSLGFKVSDPNLTKRREPRGTPCSSALPSPTASDAGDNSPRASEASSVLLPAPSVASSAPSDESEYIEGQAYMTYPIRRR